MVLFVSLKNTSDLLGDTLFPPACLSSCLYRGRVGSQGSWTCRVKWPVYQDPLWRSNLWNSQRSKATVLVTFLIVVTKYLTRSNLKVYLHIHLNTQYITARVKGLWGPQPESRERWEGCWCSDRHLFIQSGTPVHGMTWPNFKVGFPSSSNYFYKHPPKYTHTCVFMAILNPIKLMRLTIAAPVVLS